MQNCTTRSRRALTGRTRRLLDMTGPERPILGMSFDPKANSLNILRLVFAVAAMAAHAIGLMAHN